jgi:hypothetical protein
MFKIDITDSIVFSIYPRKTKKKSITCNNQQPATKQIDASSFRVEFDSQALSGFELAQKSGTTPRYRSGILRNKTPHWMVKCGVSG